MSAPTDTAFRSKRVNTEYQNTENLMSAPTDTEDMYLPARMKTDKHSSATKSATLTSEIVHLLNNSPGVLLAFYDDRPHKLPQALDSENYCHCAV